MRGHGEGTLYKNRKGLWVAKVSADGRRFERSSMDKARAQGFLREMLRQVGRGTTPAPRLTLRAFLEDWLADMEGQVRDSTLRRYKSVVKVHLLPGIGFVPIQSLRPTMVDRFLSTKPGRTGQQCREVLRNALNAALHDRLVETNAAALAKPVKHEAKAAVILTPEELGAFLEGTADDRLHALYVLAATTGMREGELLGLSWDDVDDKAQTVTVRSQLVRVGRKVTPDGWALSEPKTRKGRRTIHVPKMTAEALAAHRLKMASERTPDWRYWRLVFVNEAGDPLYGYNVVAAMRAHLKRLEIDKPGLGMHSLRHTFASLMVDEAVPHHAISDALGHTTTRLLERYAHGLPARGLDIANRMQRIAGGE